MKIPRKKKVEDCKEDRCMVFIEKKSMTTLIIGFALLATLPMNIKNIRALEEERKQRVN